LRVQARIVEARVRPVVKSDLERLERLLRLPVLTRDDRHSVRYRHDIYDTGQIHHG
jgi:hypothetical protein